MYLNSWWRTDTRIRWTTLKAEAKYHINFTQSDEKNMIYKVMFGLIKKIFIGLLTGIVSASNHGSAFS